MLTKELLAMSDEELLAETENKHSREDWLSYCQGSSEEFELLMTRVKKITGKSIISIRFDKPSDVLKDFEENFKKVQDTFGTLFTKIRGLSGLNNDLAELMNVFNGLVHQGTTAPTTTNDDVCQDGICQYPEES